MAEKDLSQIKQELQNLLQKASRPSAYRRLSTALSAGGRLPLFDLGLFILAYLFWLIVASNVLLAAGITISKLNCLLAVPLSWGTLWALRRERLPYTLLVALVGSAVILLCAYGVSFMYDFSWDGNWYHKVDAGLLAKGWNPFTQSMGDYCNESGVLPPRTEWMVWYDGYTKGSYTIGACFYALTGTIEAGKCYNLLGMIVLLCIGTTLTQKLTRLSFWQAFAVMFLIAVNPVSLTGVIIYYNEGLMAAMLAVFALSLYYLYVNERGNLAPACWGLFFLSLSVGLNVKYSGLFHFGILGAMFYLFWIVMRGVKRGFRGSGAFIARMTALFVSAVVCAVALAGATTFVVNLLRYGNPLYSVYGENATPLVEKELPNYLSRLPLFFQFLYSIFSRVQNEVHIATGNYLKIPFTFNAEEWRVSSGYYDIRSAGWGLLFGGVFVISMAVIVAGLILMKRRKSGGDHFAVILLLLAYLFIPPAFVKGLWWARYYLQLFWLPAIALALLFAQYNRSKAEGKKRRSAAAAFISLVVIASMLFDMAPTCQYIYNQYQGTEYAKDQFRRMKARDFLYDYQMDFYYNTDCNGFLFNVMDYGIDYSIYEAKDPAEELPYEVIYLYLIYHEIPERQDLPETTDAFLSSLLENRDGLCVLIAAADEASQGLDEETVRAMRALGLSFDLEGKYRYGYLAVIDSGAVVYEQASADRLDYRFDLDGHTVRLVSAGFDVGAEAQIVVDGADVSLNRRGLNVAVYDKAAGVITDTVAIDSYLDLALSR